MSELQVDVTDVSVSTEVVNVNVSQVEVEDNLPVQVVVSDVGLRGPQGPTGSVGPQGPPGPAGGPDLPDTGIRNIKGLLLPGWTADVLTITRVGRNVRLFAQNLSVAEEATESNAFPHMPGFRVCYYGIGREFIQAPGHMILNHHQNGYWRWGGGTRSLYGECFYMTDDAWPVTLPGIPA